MLDAHSMSNPFSYGQQFPIITNQMIATYL